MSLEFAKHVGVTGAMVCNLAPFVSIRDFIIWHSLKFSSMLIADFSTDVTPNIKKTTDALHKAGIKCGVALFGETIFAMVDSETEKSAISILENFKECQIIKSRIDTNGARLQTIAPVISSV